jgi:hypothetical protein
MGLVFVVLGMASAFVVPPAHPPWEFFELMLPLLEFFLFFLGRKFLSPTRGRGWPTT